MALSRGQRFMEKLPSRDEEVVIRGRQYARDALSLNNTGKVVDIVRGYTGRSSQPGRVAEHCEFWSPVTDLVSVLMMTNATREQQTERILDLTLEVNFLLTGEDYVVVKRSGDPSLKGYNADTSDSPSRSQSPGTEHPPHSQMHERNNEQKILELTNKIIHLLTGKVWEYLEEHKEPLKNLMETRQPLGSLDGLEDRNEVDGFSSLITEDGEIMDHQTIKPVTANKPRKRKSKPMRHKGALYEERELIEGDLYTHMEHTEYLSPPIQDESDLSMVENHRDMYTPTEDTQTECIDTPISEDSVSCEESFHERPSYSTPSEYISVHIKEEESSSCEERNLSDTDVYTSVEHTQTESTSGYIKEESVAREERKLAYPDLYYTSADHGEPVYASTSQEQSGSYEGKNPSDLKVQRPSRPLLMKRKTDSKTHVTQSMELINQQRHAMDAGFDSFETPEVTDVGSDPVNHHDLKKMSCSECGKTFGSKANFIGHQCLHPKPRFIRRSRPCQGENQLACSCGKCFHKMKYFRRHQAVHSGEKPFPCSQCGKSFKLKATLKSHERIHTGEKPFSCSECGKCFRQRSGRNTHQKIHTGEKPFACSVCDKSFRHKAYLITHERIHTGEKPFSCFECGKCFIEKPRLLAHMRIHTGEKPFSCSECGRCFTNYSNLLAHRKIHNGEKPFPCPECGKCFSKKVYLNAHQIQGCSNASDANY